MSHVDWRVKGLWLPDGGGQSVEEFAAARHQLFDGPFSWPVMVARRSAIEANIATMAAYCARHGVELAPHGKTTMSPSMWAAQLAAGAWGITVATAHQALVAARAGAPRILLANELLDVTALRWAAGLDAEFYCYVDSPAGVRAVAEALPDAPDGRLRLFIEMGYAGGRTGCRSVAGAVALAHAVAAIDGAEVAGVAGFEGMLPDSAAVESFLRAMVEVADTIAPMCPDKPIVTAGGSAYFDHVISTLSGPGRRVVLRSGATITHDDGFYALRTPFRWAPSEGTLTAALEVWAQVLSAPEPNLVIIGAGKRDAPFDEGLPVPLRVRGRTGTVRSAAGASVERLNDQHAYVRGLVADPGELICLGISHPCTAFDKWRVIPVVDDEYTVVDLLQTWF